jgi:CheY-like chemotaxis protein
MPEMDGFTFVEHIRQQPKFSGVNIIMLTSASHRGAAERCRELGIAAYVVKPIRKSELLASILTVLGQKAAISQPAAKARSSDAAQALHILLAEDNRVNQAVATRLLQKMGHSLVVASNGEEVISLIATQAFDLVLMDVQMPEMDGIAATAVIRQREIATEAHLPIIAMTAHAMKGDKERCLAAGMDGYVSKPISYKELEEAIAKAVSVCRRIMQSQVQEFKQSVTLPEDRLLEISQSTVQPSK